MPFQRLHLSADGARLFVRTAPGDTEARATGQGTAVAVIDTATLQQVASVPLPAPAFDAVPAPDGSALLTSNTNTQDPLAAVTRLLEVPSGRELARWQGVVVGLQARSPRAWRPLPAWRPDWEQTPDHGTDSDRDDRSKPGQ